VKKHLPRWVEGSRVTQGPLASHPGTGPNGAFLLRLKETRDLAIIASDGQGWDHVSVRVSDNSGLPTWEEMVTVKELLFHPHECAYQYHPKEKDYVDFHPLVLHIWRPHLLWMPTPPTWMIGPKGTPWLTGEEE
jgi:hypothetical protein